MANENILIRSKRKKAQAALNGNRLDEARTLYEQLFHMDRLDPQVPLILGVIAGRQHDHANAVKYLHAACKLRPDHAETHYNLGIAMREMGKLGNAVHEFRYAIDLKPDYSVAFESLVHTLMLYGDNKQAATVMREALVTKPDNAEWHSNLGTILQAQSLLEESIASYREAIRLQPTLSVAYDGLGSALTAQGRLGEALDCYRESMQRFPGTHRAYSNLLLTLNYLPNTDPEEIFQEHVKFGEALGKAAGLYTTWNNETNPDRRLRVGFVSADFRAHSVAFFIEPLLEALSRDKVEIVCYADVERPDEVTHRLQALASLWRRINEQNDDAVSELVRKDRIDILVDLGGHTGGGRLSVFARKPVPLQVSYLGYPNTTGLAAIDYRFTDAIADSLGEDKFYTEKLIRIPECFLCYRPLVDAPPVSVLPMLEIGQLTFGSFNNLSKIGPDVIALWARLVNTVPASRLLIKNPSLTDATTRERYQTAFAAHGLDRDRVELIGHTPTQSEHLALYGRIDVALDTFPYNGTTTTCEALWMGVPVITLVGQHHAGRVGFSLLQAIGHSDWAARSENEFVAKAATLAANPYSLSIIRANLRTEMEASPLCDAHKFAKKIERILCEIWQDWCASRKQAST